MLLLLLLLLLLLRKSAADVGDTVALVQVAAASTDMVLANKRSKVGPIGDMPRQVPMTIAVDLVGSFLELKRVMRRRC